MDTSGLRTVMLSSWEPPHAVAMRADEEGSLSSKWQQLKDVFSVEAWDAVMALSGQLLEALVKHRLVELGCMKEDIARKTLGSLLQVGSHVGIVGEGLTGSVVPSALSTALILRNWASHYSFWAREANETQSLQSLVLLVAAAEALYPSTPRSFDMIDPIVSDSEVFARWRSLAPVYLIQRLESSAKESLPPSLSVDSYDFCHHVVRSGMPRTIVRFDRILGKHWKADDNLKGAINNEFICVVQHAVRSSFKHIVDLLILMRRLGLKNHSQIMAILLPSDVSFLCALVEGRSPAYVACYMAECARADRSLLSAKLGRAAYCSRLSRSVWRRFGNCTGNIINIANILAKFPGRVRAEILRKVPAGLIDWISESDPANSINLLSCFSPAVVESNPDLCGLRDDVVRAIVSSLPTTHARSLSRLPLRLHRMGAIHPDSGEIILLKLIECTRDVEDSSAGRRILWDIFSFAPNLSDAAIEAAIDIIDHKQTQWSKWDIVCLCGMTAVSGRATNIGCTSLFDTNEEEEVRARLNTVDRWQVFLVAVGLGPVEKARRTDIHHILIARAKYLFSNTREPDNPAARRLLELTREITS